MDVSVVVVGDEILSGYVQDANTHLIATRVAHHGHRLTRAVIVGDQREQIAAEIRAALDGGAGLVVVCGGLGPTHDDRTMEGVADALGLTLEPCPALVDRIEAMIDHARASGFTETAFGIESLRKMALAPAGSQMLVTASGVLPAVALEHGPAAVVVLPGPPRLLEIVFTECVEPRYLEGTGATVWREEITHRFPESALAAGLTALQERYPETSIGSYPQRGHTLVRIAGPQADVAAVAAALRAQIDDLLASDEGRRYLAFIEDRRKRSG